MSKDAYCDIIATRDVAQNIKQTALINPKTHHGVSEPVLRYHEDKMCLAAFVFFYDREELQTAKMKRPTMWVIADLETGKIKYRFSCFENEFSYSEYHKYYSVLMGENSYDDNCWNSAYALMDIIRNEYITYGIFREDLYKEYFERVFRATPIGYRNFYTDLSL